jgi:hypothetical protein
MKTICLLILLFCIAQFSKGQEPQAKDFYQNLAKAIDIDSGSITLKTINYGCLGSKTSWTVKIKSIGEVVRIDFYKELKNTANSFDKLDILDTSFTVKKSVLKENLKAEINEIKTRPVFIEASFNILLNYGDSEKEFRFRRGEGLYYLFRYNKKWNTYFAIK